MALRSSPSAMATSTSSTSARPAVMVALPSASTCSARRMCAAPQHHQLSAAPKLGRRAASWVARSSTETQQPASPPQAAPVAKKSAQPEELVPDTEFSITKVSYGSILTPVGVGLLAYGFGAFFQLLPGADVSSLMLIYGFPISLLGFALSYAQLKPVPCKTTKAAFELRASQMTDIQKQVREDVTRFRYGDEQHLDEALEKIFRFGKSGGVPRKNSPRLRGVREEVSEQGAYTLVLEFESVLPLTEWESRQPKFQSFFGPGILAVITPVAGGVEVALVSDGTGAGRTGVEKKDVLPPLVPGAKPRRQD